MINSILSNVSLAADNFLCFSVLTSAAVVVVAAADSVAASVAVVVGAGECICCVVVVVVVVVDLVSGTITEAFVNKGEICGMFHCGEVLRLAG